MSLYCPGMGRQIQYKDRMLRDGREVEVLSTCAKPYKHYKRQAAIVKDKVTGEQFEIWYSQLCDIANEPVLRAKRDAGFTTRGSFPVANVGIDLAFEVDGLVAIAKACGTQLGGENSEAPTILALARVVAAPMPDDTVKVKVYDPTVSKTRELERLSYPVSCWDGSKRLQDAESLVPIGGPGYARLWRGEEAPEATNGKSWLDRQRERYVSKLPHAWHSEQLLGAVRPEKLRAYHERQERKATPQVPPEA